MLGAEEVRWQGKQIWCSFGLVDVNDILALWVDVEAHWRHFALGVCDLCGLPARGEKSCEVERKGAAKALQRRRGLLVWWIRRQVPKLMDRCRLRKRSALVVQSSVVPFAVLCGERRCVVELKGNAVKRQTEVRASCLQFCERFAILVVDGE